MKNKGFCSPQKLEDIHQYQPSTFAVHENDPTSTDLAYEGQVCSLIKTSKCLVYTRLDYQSFLWTVDWGWRILLLPSPSWCFPFLMQYLKSQWPRSTGTLGSLHRDSSSVVLCVLVWKSYSTKLVRKKFRGGWVGDKIAFFSSVSLTSLSLQIVFSKCQNRTPPRVGWLLLHLYEQQHFFPVAQIKISGAALTPFFSAVFWMTLSKTH